MTAESKLEESLPAGLSRRANVPIVDRARLELAATVERTSELADRWIAIEPSERETLRAALERVLREAILAGALREGVRMPSSRSLARQLQVSRGVVSDAYGQLEAQGFLATRPRSAPVVAGVVKSARAAPSEAAAEVRPPLHDLTPTSPDVSLFPLSQWLRTLQSVARLNEVATLEYREPRGEQVLRSAVADHLSRTRGVIADPHDIVIVQGTAQGIDILLRVLRERGRRRLALEDPSHPTQQQRARAHEFELCPRPVDADGMVVGPVCADAALVTPAHQFPTGAVMSGERRRALLAWAREQDALVIEDDYDSEFRYGREPVRALQGLAPDRVVQIGTVSKTLAPALRLGWLVAPNELVDEIAEMKRLVDDFSPALDQLALAEFLASGRYHRHLRRARAVYARRREALRAALAAHMPEASVVGVSAGLHLLMRLPDDVDDTLVVGKLLRRRIRVTPLSELCVTRATANGLVIGYARLHESAADGVVREIADVLAEVRSGEVAVR
jgi:GntR family transcriptional regulator / MocR family aminotransferase